MVDYKADCACLKSEEGSVGLLDLGDSIDASTFEQIREWLSRPCIITTTLTNSVEMDDDEDDREFSRSIVHGFFEQAEQTFIKMDDAL